MKVGLLLDNKISNFRLKTLGFIIDDPSFSIDLAVIDDRPKQKPSEKIMKNLRRGRGGYIIIMAIESLLSKSEPFEEAINFCSKNKIDVIKATDPYSPEVINKIRNYDLDALLLIGGYGIIKSPLIDITRIGILSYHHGDMRKYRGMPPAFWEMYNDEKEMGVTVQLLSEGLDCGVPIIEKRIEIFQDDTLKTLRKRAYEMSEDMMYLSLQALSNEKFVQNNIEQFGKIYTLPNFRHWLYFQIKNFGKKIR